MQNGFYNIINLDYNYTATIEPRILDAMLPFLMHNFANPISTYHFGRKINDKL
jgi:cysteine desulfurase